MYVIYMCQYEPNLSELCMNIITHAVIIHTYVLKSEARSQGAA